MSLNAKEVPMTSNRERPEPLEPGAYPARVVGIATVGVQEQRAYQGKEKSPATELYLTYELLDEFMVDEEGEPDEERPRWISEFMVLHNLAAERATSTKRYYALDPDEAYGGDFAKLHGIPCIINIVNTEGKGQNKGRIYENVSSVSSMRPKEVSKAPPLVNEGFVFDFDNPEEDELRKVPFWLRNKMKEALNYKGTELEQLIKKLEAEWEEEKAQQEKEEKPKSRGRTKIKEEVKEDESW